MKILLFVEIMMANRKLLQIIIKLPVITIVIDINKFSVIAVFGTVMKLDVGKIRKLRSLRISLVNDILII